MLFTLYTLHLYLFRCCFWYRGFAFSCNEGLPLRPFRPFIFSWRSWKKFSQLVEVQPWWKSIWIHTDANKWWGNTCCLHKSVWNFSVKFLYISTMYLVMLLLWKCIWSPQAESIPKCILLFEISYCWPLQSSLLLSLCSWSGIPATAGSTTWTNFLNHIGWSAVPEFYVHPGNDIVIAAVSFLKIIGNHKGPS